MKKNYNYTREKLFLPEYGRHIQEMAYKLLEIEDRDERTRQAKAVIAVMGNINPLLRDSADFKHKLWDHLFIMSDFRLDVDSPYPVPARQDLQVTPHPMSYTQSRIRYKHYGKYIERLVQKLAEEPEKEGIGNAVAKVAKCMRAKSYEYNQEHPNNDQIIHDILEISEGRVHADESALGSFSSELRAQRHDKQNKFSKKQNHKSGAQRQQHTGAKKKKF